MNDRITPGTFLFACTVIVCSCSALTKAQKTTIKDFATSAKTYTDGPKELLATYSQCLYKTDQLEASMEATAGAVLTKLDTAANKYYNRLHFTTDFTETYQLLNKYFQALLDFADVDTATATKNNIGTLGVGMDSLISKSNNVNLSSIPIGFGSIAGNLVKYIGQRRISQLQLKYFRQFADSGTVALQQISTVLQRALFKSLIQGDLDQGEKQLPGDFEDYLKKDSASKKPSSYYKELGPAYLDLKTCFNKAKLLMRKLDEVTTQLVNAHTELVSLLKTKKKKLSTPKISAFIAAVGQLNELIKQLKESKAS